jgi:hypothetical protein
VATARSFVPCSTSHASKGGQRASDELVVQLNRKRSNHQHFCPGQGNFSKHLKDGSENPRQAARTPFIGLKHSSVIVWLFLFRPCTGRFVMRPERTSSYPATSSQCSWKACKCVLVLKHQCKIDTGEDYHLGWTPVDSILRLGHPS